MLWTAMPKAAIKEDSDFRSRKDKIYGSSEAR
jgi:hypothetical protein